MINKIKLCLLSMYVAEADIKIRIGKVRFSYKDEERVEQRVSQQSAK